MLNFDSVTLLEKVEVIEAAWLEVSKADSLKSKMHPPKLFSSLQVFIYLFIYFYVFHGYLQVVNLSLFRQPAFALTDPALQSMGKIKEMRVKWNTLKYSRKYKKVVLGLRVIAAVVADPNDGMAAVISSEVRVLLSAALCG